MASGHVTLGLCVSRTVTVNEQVLVLCAASKAVQVTVVVPSANVLPLAGKQVTLSLPSTMSLAVAVKVTVAPAALVASAVIGAGQLTVGAVVSRTVTANEQVLVLCAASKAVQVTVVLPRAKVLPLAGEQVTLSVPSTMSLAVAVKVTVAPAALVASAVIGAGQLTVGAVVSRTVTANEQVLVLCAASKAVQVTVVLPRANVLPLAGEQVTLSVPSTMS